MHTSHGQSAPEPQPEPQEDSPSQPSAGPKAEFESRNVQSYSADSVRPASETVSPTVSQPPSQPPLKLESVGPPTRVEIPLQLASEGRPPLAPNLRADLRSPLHIVDLVGLVFFYLIAGTLITIALAFGARLLFGISTTALENSTNAKSLVILLSQSVLSGATLLFLYGLVRARSPEPFWPAVGWRRFKGLTPPVAAAVQFLFIGSLLAIVAGWASSFMDRDVVLPMEELLRSRQSVLLLMGLGVLVAPAVEETIFRGCIYPILARHIGIGGGVFATGLLFGLAHAPQLWPGYGQIALLIVVGIVLTYVRARTGTVLASYLVHTGYNMLLFAGFFWSTGALRHLPS